MKLGSTCAILVLCFCACAHAQCPIGDLNRDGRTDFHDLKLLGKLWLTRSQTVPNLSGEPNMNGIDFATLAAHWQETGCPIVINEILAHSHANAPDWIELYNTAAIPVNVGGWWLSDKESDLYKFRIPANTVVEPFGYVVFYENTHFGNPFNPDVLSAFAFSENGEACYLYSGDDPVFPGYLVQETFGASETGYSFGRHPRSDGGYRFPTMSYVTPGAANAYPLVGPVVINEIMYHPADNADAEYIELLNISGGPVTLFDYTSMLPWRFIDDSGVGLWLPSDPPVTLERNEHILLVRRAALLHPIVPAGVKMLEWGAGRLSNRGETLFLLKPGDVDDAGTRYWIEVDRVDYSDGSHPEDFPKKVDPWPTEADGFGFSLNRIFPSRYGNDPNNWHATIPTPGSTND